jgi:hypothetical protein
VWAKAALLSSPAATTSVVNPVLKSDLNSINSFLINQ